MRGKAPQQSPDRDLRFHAGQRHAGAGVNAGGESEMAIGLAADVEAIGIGKLRRIAVGGADADVHVGAGGQVDAAEPRVAVAAPIAELVRAFHPQEFLDRGCR